MVNQWLYTHVPTVRQAVTRMSYEYISIIDRDVNLRFLNYGYADLNPDTGALQLFPEDENQRYEAQLYHRIATTIPINWEGLDVLEVSSGRGGGSCFIKSYFQPKSVIGVDFCRKAVNFCNQHYAIDGLSFLHGNAEALDFPDNSFDVVINIEASFYYPHIERFFSHVVRVLRPNGHFLYADMRYAEELGNWQAQLRRMGLHLLSEEDITRNVINALALDQERRMTLLQNYVPRILHKPFAQLAGITSSGLSNGNSSSAERKRTYKNYIFRKNGSQNSV